MPAEKSKPAHALTAAELVVENTRARMTLAMDAGAMDTDSGDMEALEKDIAKRLSGDEGAYRSRLISLFRLNEAEAQALDMAVAVAVEPMLGQQMSEIQGFTGRYLPSEIALRILYDTGPEFVVAGTSPLLTWGLVEQVQFAPGEPVFFRADPAVVDWYFGKLSASFMPLKKPEQHDALPEWDVQRHAGHIQAILDKGKPARVRIYGKAGMGRASFAACIAREMSRQSVLISSDGIKSDSQRHIFLMLQRMALLGDIALIWRHYPGGWASDLPVSMLQFIIAEEDETLDPRDDVIDISIELPEPGRATYDALFGSYLPKLAKKMTGPTGQARLRDLSDAAAQGLTDVDEFRAFLRQRNSARTGNIGQIEQADFTWDDLILQDHNMAMLRAFSDEAKARADLLNDPERRRIFQSSSHLTALFAGPPGLGKSMSARVIANDLGLDLLSVDLAAIQSKFIGETPKNLTNAFEIARDAQCALLFEEADSLFSTRVKVETSNDAHKNTDTSHLLKLMESFDVVVMMSTNLRTNIDSAFTRRIRTIVEFKKPEMRERERLWSRMLALLGMDKDDLAGVVPDIAAAYELTPAQIKSACLTAAYGARKSDRSIEMQDIQVAVRTEFQKEGRLIRAVPGTAGRRVNI